MPSTHPPASPPRYEGMTRDELAERLSAAEDLCLMFGWSAYHEDTDRDVAAYLLWKKWVDLAGDFANPKHHSHLSDKAMAPLVAEEVERRDSFRQMARSIVVEPTR